MDTRGKTNAEFRNEVNEILARLELSFDQVDANFDQVNATLQSVLTKLQALRFTQSPRPPNQNINPFAIGQSTHINRVTGESSQTN